VINTSDLSKKSVRQFLILKALKIRQSFCGCESHFPHILNSELQPSTKPGETENISYTSGRQMAEASSQTARRVSQNQLVSPGNPKSMSHCLLTLWRAECLTWVC